MARQLVFTSAPQGLTPGRTGYCTVARHRDLRERLVPILESLSVYPSDWKPSPVICVFRMVDVGGTQFPVLSRLVDSGYDYTSRNHYLAHHLVLDPNESEFAPTPADIFLRWPGWLNKWTGDARWMDERDLVNLNTLPSAPTPALPALAWQSLAGDPGNAVHLLDGNLPGNRVLRCAAGRESEILYLYRESAALLPAAERWRTEFTNCLQPAEPASSFHWVGVRAGSPSDAIASRSGVVFDLTKPEALPRVPDNVTVRMARGLASMPTKRVAATASVSRKDASAPSPLPTLETAAPTPIQAPKPVASKPRNYWIWGGIAGVIAGIAATAMILAPDSGPQYLPNRPTTVSPVSPNNFSSPSNTASSPTTTTAFPALTTATTAVGNEQALLEIQQLATSGKYLDGLAKWSAFSAATPDLAQAHIDFLNNQLLPGARKEWMEDINQISLQLNAGTSKRAELEARLSVLQSSAREWSFPNPDEMETAAKRVATILQFLSQIPEVPVWIVDNFTPAGTGPDYEDVSATLEIPDLVQLLSSATGKFQISAAPATSIILPPADSWFNFNVLNVDFDAGNYLILHDSSRGAAGGRYLQLDHTAPGTVRITWRLFQPDSNFFKRFPANAPLRPISRELWLRFTAEPPLTSFDLLLRRQDNFAIEA
ncbi:MAG TPA: hypothetical protein VK737_10865, partial [Opitutales bacterium]|nr:hypothetical protein [Opitutales bacterium]